MPPRKSHKKSRAGCRRCKNRKIKCDEVHPRCGNCSKHGVPCDFGNPEVVEDLTNSTPESPPPQLSPTAPFANSKCSSIQTSPRLAPVTPSFSRPMDSEPVFAPSRGPRDRHMELRLMHQYTYITSKTLFLNSPYTEDIWQRAVPEMAFSGKNYLVDAMLSVAALHLRSIRPEEKALAHASHAYATSTLADFRANLGKGITADNAEALFLTASLIAFQAVASRIFTKDDSERDANGVPSRYELPLPWFHAFQGVKTVVATSWMWIRDSAVCQAVIDAQPSLQIDLNPSAPNTFFGHLLEDIQVEMSNEASDRVAETTQAYFHAVCVLNWVHKSPYPAATLAFAATVSRRYVDLLDEKRPRALAILACFFGLLKRMDGVWWLKDVARREVMGLVGMFETGSKWWAHLEWPIRIALWDGGAMIPSDVWGTECDAEPVRDDGNVETMMSHIELITQLINPPRDKVATSMAYEEEELAPASPD